MTSTAEPLIVHWALGVDHPHDTTQDTVVHCTTTDGRKVELRLDDGLREALGLVLVDPKGEMDQPNDCCGQERGALAFLCRGCGDPQIDADALGHPCRECDAPAGRQCGSECQPGAGQ